MSRRRGTTHETWIEGTETILANVEDGYYFQRFANWDELEQFIAETRATATQAWGPPNSQASLADRVVQTGLTPDRNP